MTKYKVNFNFYVETKTEEEAITEVLSCDCPILENGNFKIEMVFNGKKVK